MAELIPGVRHWNAVHPNLGMRVSSYALEAEGVLFNPLLPRGDRGVLDGIDVRAIILTNRHHLRDSEKLAGDGVAIHAPAAGLHDLRDAGAEVVGYRDGDELPGGTVAVEVGSLSPDEFAVFVPEHRALAVADGAMRDGDGPLRAFPDGLLGDDPVAVKHGLADAYERLCDELAFDHLLLAHGEPVVGEGPATLLRYAEWLRGGSK